MDISLITEIDNTRQSLLETYELMEKYSAHTPDADLKDPTTYLQLVEQLCEIKHESTLQEHALHVSREAQCLEDFVEAYNDGYANAARKKFNPKKLKEYKDFKKRLNEITDKSAVGASSNTSRRVECDEFVMEGAINVQDPMTKLRMQNPVRNKLCGHHYDKATILEAISNNKLRCPVAGCGNREFVIASHLIEDNEMRKRIKQIKETESQDPLD